MSWICLLAADHPLPLYQSTKPRTRCISCGRQWMEVAEDGFAVMEHEYYRSAVDELGLIIKPYRYELDLRATPDDLNGLRSYLEGNLTPGDEAQLWGLWVGGDEARPVKYRGALDALNMEALDMLEMCHPVCLTIEK